MIIQEAASTDYPALIELWERSVRATHHFLTNDDIMSLKPLILAHYFDAVALRCAKNTQGNCLGFIGVHEGNIEMLFVEPEHRALGVGSALTQYAIALQGAIKVDVNEQNEQALGFYLHQGFNIIGRSELDGQGNPYPLLHLQLTDT